MVRRVPTSSHIEARIARLQSEYKDSFALVRDKMVAHRQKEDLLTLFEHWVQVDQVAGVVLRDDMLDIYDRLAALQAVPERAMPAEIPDAIAAAQRFGTETTRPWWDLSLYALANQNSGAVLPTSPMLEKLQQALAAVTGILVFNRIVSKLPQSGILEFLRAQVGVVDLCSLLDNVFLDRPDDEGLVTRWQKMKHRGSAILLGFRRRPALEEVLRLARGKVLAHLDSDSTWADMSLIVSMIPWADVGTYYNELWHTMKRALAAEMATALYAGHGEEMHESVVGMAKTVKPFLA